MQLADGRRTQTVAGLLLLAALALALLPGNSTLLQRFDLLIYDLLLPLQSPPMSRDITVVAIDNRSLETLGRWPWDRARHAELLDKLNALNARVVGLDILFSEYQQNNPDSDRRLAQALTQTPVVLPVAPARRNTGEPIGELLPLPEFAAAAAALGHVDLEIDLDGLCRSIFLYGGIGEARWASLSLAMLRTAYPRQSVPASRIAANAAPAPRVGWLRGERRLIPFSRPDVVPSIVSFSDVLDDLVPREKIAGKFVLVGVTASGLGDEVSTPGAASHERMPGVLVNAQILNGLLGDNMISPLTRTAQLAVSATVSLAAALIIVLLPLRFILTATALALTLVLAATAALLSLQRGWFAPASSILAIVVSALLWAGWLYHRERQLSRDLEERLNHLASFHAATGLPNYAMLENRLRALSEGNPASGISALMVMHINWPGSATIVLDRPISDGILRAIRDRLKDISRPGSFVAHLSGDDFAVVTTDFDSVNAAHKAAAEFLENVQAPLEHDGEPLLLVPQIGVSLWPTDTADPQQLLRNAYTAMFSSRMDEVEQLCTYSSSVSDELQVRSRMEQAMVHALERREFKLYYQPQVAAASGEIVGVEALLRWNNPQLGWISSDTFVPVAEHIGLIQSIGNWVIEESCAQLQRWQQAGIENLRLAINISPRQFLGQSLESDIQQTIQRSGVDPAHVELEITESSLMRDVDNAIKIMHRMKDFGLELAIDDFGTGYSSLSSLRHFPLDRLKIDMAFIREIGERQDAEELTLTIIAIARQLGLGVIAEGVEIEEQAAFLRANGCDELQGYLFARPMPPEELTDLLEKNALGVPWC